MLIVVSIIVQALFVLWAIYTKIRKGVHFETYVVTMCGFGLVINAAVSYCMFKDIAVPFAVDFVRNLVLVQLVPLAYMYFTRKIGRQWNNYIICMLWMLMVFIFFPYLVVVVDRGTINLCDLVLDPYKTYFVYKGTPIIDAYTTDLVMMVQGLVTIAVMLPVIYMMRRYGLKLSRRVNIFFFWWLMTIAYMSYTSFVTPEDLDSVGLQWVFFGLHFLITCIIFTMLALDFDMNPVVTAILSENDQDDSGSDGPGGGSAAPSGMPAAVSVDAAQATAKPVPTVMENAAMKPAEENVSLDAFISLCREMAAKLRVLIYEENAYRNADFKADDAIQYLGTNRTYFARMMNAEFGCKFSDLINEERLKYAHELLLNTEKSVTEIAAESGFSDASYFSKKFSQKYGMSPKQFRSE